MFVVRARYLPNGGVLVKALGRECCGCPRHVRRPLRKPLFQRAPARDLGGSLVVVGSLTRPRGGRIALTPAPRCQAVAPRTVDPGDPQVDAALLTTGLC